MSYAGVSDLEARIGKPFTTDAEKERAAVLLNDASAVLDAFVDASCDCALGELLKIVCCNMVMRSLAATANELYGVSSSTISADIYSQTLQFANPTGDFYLTKMDKKLLGISDGYIGSIRPKIGTYYD